MVESQVPRQFGTYFVPGPTEVRPEILDTLTRPVIPHREPDFEAMFARIQAGLGDVLLTGRPVYVGSCSATGFMELGIRNTPPGRILSLVNGAFSERFALVAESCAREVDRLIVDWGETFDLEEVETRLAAAPYTAVTVAHSETSTGVLTDVSAIASLAHQYGAMALVDAVSSAGGAKLTVDAWGLDFVCTASQKAMALPAGLAFAVASPDFLERARTLTDRGFYFDVVQYDNFAARNQTPSTPATTLLYALEAQLGDMTREGIERRWERHAAMRDATVEWAAACSDRRMLDLHVLAPDGARSPTVSVLMLPPGLSGPEVRAAARDRGFTLGASLGDLRDQSIRIGHMGDHTLEGLGRCLHALENAIAELAERKNIRGLVLR
jgi:aspartate aminotransferase-like enzyme